MLKSVRLRAAAIRAAVFGLGAIAVVATADDNPGPLPEAAGLSVALSLTGTDPLGTDSIAGALPSLTASDDLISHLRRRMSLPDDEHLARPSVRTQLNWYVRHPSYMKRVLTRADRYLYYIVSELEARDMPVELALLPIVESAFDPFAYSHGRAAGLWQIIPGTGRRFRLKQNWWYDGRRDVVASTRAALDYLELLHRQFDGDWLLAVAAYNSGEGNVAKARRRNRRAGKPTDFWHLKLPKETRAYVPKLLALRALVRAPEAWSVTLPDIANEPHFASVDTGSQIDLSLASELAGVGIDELYALNPGFNRWATDPDGPHHLLVPVSARDRFEAALIDLPAERRVRWQRYQIRSGDTLSTIAERFGTTTRVIREANGVSGSRIRAGKHLMIPTAHAEASHYKQSADARLARKLNTTRGRDKTLHTVRSGESFWTISRHYGVSLRALAGWNGMAPRDTLSVGRELVVWNPKQNARVTPAAWSPSTPSGTRRKIHYTVRSGDSLSRVANRFRVSVSDLRKWNPRDSRKKYLQPGQTLVLYVDVTRQSGT